MQSSSVFFFINGCLIIKKDNNYKFGFSYEMRFLTETNKSEYIDMLIYDIYGNFIKYEDYIDGLKLIKIDCTSFMENSYKTYIRLKYIVKYNNNEFNGSFPLISPKYQKNLNFVCVSCNNNQKEDDNNDYHYKRVNHTINLWNHIAKRKPDIIFHMGDQIYGDYIIDNKIGHTKKDIYLLEEIFEAYANLYRTAYAEKNQARAMCNSINIMILDDHEICDSFGTFGSKRIKNNTNFLPYYKSGMKAYILYQHQLHHDINHDIINDIITGNKPIYYNVSYGKYKIILLDERHEWYHKKNIFTDEQINWVKKLLIEGDDFIIISPRPIGHLDKINAYLQGVFSNDGKDELFHPNNYKRTCKLLKCLDDSNKKIFILAGDVHKTFINNIYNKNTNKLIATQLVASAITRIPRGYLNIMVRFAHYLQKNKPSFKIKNFKIGNKKYISNNNNYGIIENNCLDNFYIKKYNNSCIWLN